MVKTNKLLINSLVGPSSGRVWSIMSKKHGGGPHCRQQATATTGRCRCRCWPKCTHHMFIMKLQTQTHKACTQSTSEESIGWSMIFQTVLHCCCSLEIPDHFTRQNSPTQGGSSSWRQGGESPPVPGGATPEKRCSGSQEQNAKGSAEQSGTALIQKTRRISPLRGGTALD